MTVNVEKTRVYDIHAVGVCAPHCKVSISSRYTKIQFMSEGRYVETIDDRGDEGRRNLVSWLFAIADVLRQEGGDKRQQTGQEEKNDKG